MLSAFPPKTNQFFLNNKINRIQIKTLVVILMINISSIFLHLSPKLINNYTINNTNIQYKKGHQQLLMAHIFVQLHQTELRLALILPNNERITIFSYFSFKAGSSLSFAV